MDLLKKIPAMVTILIAKKIAESAGGVFGYLSIGYEESKLIDLNMINAPY